MHYPFWDVPIGYGQLMAAIAVIHVFISHFAIGGGLFLVVGEMRARRRGDELRLAFLQKLTKFFVLVTLVLGALTGVAIWFVIGLLNPAATEALIHNFVWGWAVEWTFFVVEISAALLYYHGWKTMSAKAHVALGWIYFVAAWLSLVVIDAILSFMLTPGTWLETGSFWDGVFNPTYLSSLVLRTGVCVMLAGLWSLVVASRLAPGSGRDGIVRECSAWAIAGAAVVVATWFWFLAAIPADVMKVAHDRMPFPMKIMPNVPILAVVIAAATVLLGLLLAKRFHLVTAIVLMAIGLAWFGSFEWFRESLRKPWIVYGYMYGNGIEAASVAGLKENGLLPSLAYRTGDDGRDLWNRACRTCHTLNGYKPLAPALAGTDAPYVAGLVRGLERIRGHMPPFPGTREESEILGKWIASHVDQRPLTQTTGLTGTALGERVWQARCVRCHGAGGAVTTDVLATFDGWSADDVAEFLTTAGDVSDEMPPMTADETERAALAEYLAAKAKGGQS